MLYDEPAYHITPRACATEHATHTERCSAPRSELSTSRTLHLSRLDTRRWAHPTGHHHADAPPPPPAGSSEAPCDRNHQLKPALHQSASLWNHLEVLGVNHRHRVAHHLLQHCKVDLPTHAPHGHAPPPWRARTVSVCEIPFRSKCARVRAHASRRTHVARARDARARAFSMTRVDFLLPGRVAQVALPKREGCGARATDGERH